MEVRHMAREKNNTSAENRESGLANGNTPPSWMPFAALWGRESVGARWSETDLAEATWKIPGDRMKGGRPHRVPLSARALELLANLPREGDFVFLGRRTGANSHNMIMSMLLRRMGHAVTPHGFRSSFRTWAGERTNFAREVVEAALAHVIGDAAEQAYARGDMVARRRQLMESWSEYCSQPDVANGVVVPLRQGA
jgi:integrase